MRKQLLVAAMVIGVLALAGSNPAYAQNDVSRVTVPFDFVVGNTLLPAGPYVITTVVNHSDMLAIRSVDGKAGTTAFAQVTGSNSRPAQAVFSFQKIAGQYFLSQVSIPGFEDRAILARQRGPAASARLNGAAPRPTL